MYTKTYTIFNFAARALRAVLYCDFTSPYTLDKEVHPPPPPRHRGTFPRGHIAGPLSKYGVYFEPRRANIYHYSFVVIFLTKKR